MKLNHINLVVPDVAAACNFFEQYFDFTTGEVKGHHMIAVQKGADGFILVLMAASLNKSGPVTYPDAFHIGFLTDTREEVERIYERLHVDGHATKAPQKIRDSYGFYFHMQGVMIEVSAAMA